ncbi:hypothetical protein Q5752_001937 [Cryptotrichosporon argae]
MSGHSDRAAPSEPYAAAVVGAGPGGLAAVCGLLDRRAGRVLWVDRSWAGGRLNERYREISSNTKVGIYLDALGSSPTCARTMAALPADCAVREMERMDRDGTCRLSLAGDVVRLLIDALRARDDVDCVRADLPSAEWISRDETWTLDLPSSPRARELVLATGSLPLTPTWHTTYNASLTALDLDMVLSPSLLAAALPASARVVVIGGSHSGVLALRNLYELSVRRTDGARIMGVGRHAVRYAEYRADGVVWDNTGLKGDTAAWARAVLAGAHDGRLNFVVIPQGREEETYSEILADATHIVYAVGYARAPIPRLSLDGEQVEPAFEPASNSFTARGKRVPALRGAGIAFPKRSTDPKGHEEDAVGVAKFFKFDAV